MCWIRRLARASASCAKGDFSARFVEPVPSSTLLPAAAGAVVAEVRKSRPTAELVKSEAWFAGDPGFSWGRFAERYCLAWEARGDR